MDVFVSHAATDDKQVSRIHAALRVAGIAAWVDHEQGITYGTNWSRAIHDAANDCRQGLFILSQDSAKSEYCEAEWNRILGLGKRLYIARIAEVPLVDIPLRLGTIQYADLVHDFEGGVAELIRAMQGQRDLDPQAPTIGQARRVSGLFPRWQLDLPLIGREDDLKAILALLAENNRAVQVLGLGGVGKTRLAAEIAVQSALKDGVIWHEITPYTTLATLTSLLRDHLRTPKEADDEAVWETLNGRAVLLVLDNAEDCRERARYAARANQLNLTGGTRILITSRYRWDEVRHAKIHDLYVPSPTAGVAILRAMAEAEPPRYPVNGQAEALAQAAHYHPRLMLFAVRWLKKYPPAQVLKTMNDLKGRDAQEALQNMVIKTVVLVEAEPDGPAAIQALRRLAVCRGGFTFEAAQAILGEAADPGLVGLLNDWSLVTLEKERYAIDPLVIAAVSLDESARRAHYDYYKALAKQQDKKQDYLDLDPESANLESAFEWTLAAGHAADAYWLANACHYFLANRGRFGQRLDWLERVATALEDTPDERLRAAVQNSLGIIYQEQPTGERQANLRRAIAAYTEALRFFTAETAPLDYAVMQNNLGTAYRTLSEIEGRGENLQRAIAAYNETLRFRTPATAPLDYAVAQNNLGVAYSSLAEVEDGAGNLRRAIDAYSEALRFRLPNTAPLDYATTQYNLGNAYRNLAQVEEQEKNLRQAVVAYTEALRFYTAEAAPLDYARTQHGLGNIHWNLGHPGASVVCWREAEKYYRLMDMVEEADLMLRWIGAVESQGDL